MVSFACTKDNKKKEPEYTTVAIKSFNLSQIPFVKSGGGSWEDVPLLEGGPDVYWLITDAYDTVYYGSRDLRYDNITHNILPLVRILQEPMEFTPLSASWFVKVYDYDLIGGDDLMAILGPFKFNSYKEDHPNAITLSGDSAIMKIGIEWRE